MFAKYGIGNFIKPRNPGYHRSEAQAEFGVAREETDGPREWLIQRLSKCTPHRHQYPPLMASRCGVSLKQEKPPQTRGLSIAWPSHRTVVSESSCQL